MRLLASNFMPCATLLDKHPMHYSVTWNVDDFIILKRPSIKLEESKPIAAFRDELVLVREVVEGRQGVTIGCRLMNASSPEWTWLAMTNAMIFVFGAQVTVPLIDVLKACPTDLMFDKYAAYHGKEYA